MKSRFVFCAAVLLAAGALYCAPGHANPYSMNVVRGMQVPETFHVQLTYTCLYCTQERAAALVAITRDDAELEVQGASTVVANHGSGTLSAFAAQACDCGLPPGIYTYHFEPNGGGEAYPMNLEVTVIDPPPGTEPEPSDGDVRAEAADAFVEPWDEPEPAWPQGIDCVAVCAAPSPEPAGEVGTIPPVDEAASTDIGPSSSDMGPSSSDFGPSPSDVTATPIGDAIGPGTVQSGSGDTNGCNAGPRAGSGFLLLAAMAALLLAWRRSRAR